MKLKKLFAGIVAVAMMATMAIPGFAAGTTAATKNTTSAVDNAGQVTIALKYNGTGFKTDPTGVTFDHGGAAYDLKNTSLTGTQYTAAKALTIGAGAFTATEGGTENKLTIQLPTYTNVGTYYYSFTQSVSTTDGMTHDATKMYLMVHVINEDGEDLTNKTGLKCMVAILNADPTNTATNLTNSKIDSLTNTYKSKDMVVEKIVKGDLGDRNQEFNFKVVLTKTKAVTGEITFKAPHETEIKINSSDWSADNTYTTKVFMMKHGESASFANLPEGVSIKAYEVVDNKGESVGEIFGSYTVTGNETEVTVSETSATKITITNKSNEHVDTGVILDNAPYIALLTIVAAGAVVMIMKKRRNYED